MIRARRSPRRAAWQAVGDLFRLYLLSGDLPDDAHRSDPLDARFGAEADRLNYVFITVDPQRDTVKLMHDYVSSFDPRLRGFTGTPEQVAAAAKAFRVYYRRIPTSDGSYEMDHSAFIYLMGPDDKYANIIAYGEKDAFALKS